MEIRALKDRAYDSSWPARALVRAGLYQAGATRIDSSEPSVAAQR